ncbi:MAG: CotH kinase family protein [Verrucomicrobiales bacterium]|nr:CotH kinase family protein [Verrucomicrobiales bacterium]
MKPHHAVILALLQTLPGNAQVVINEIFYNAPEDQDDVQWIELHNTTKESADLSGWRLAKAIKFAFPSNFTIAPNGYAILCKNKAAFATFYSISPAGEFDTALKQNKQNIELIDRDGRTVDRIEFDDEPPWPLGPDGWSASLERICPTCPGTQPENWIGSPLSEDSERPGGTPGTKNAGFSATFPPVISAVMYPSKAVAPQQPIAVEAKVQSKSALKQVALRYRIVSSGSVGEETVVPMTSSGNDGVYRGSIPGQAAGRIVRFRIGATDANDAERLHPAPTEPRPAFSCLVFTHDSRAKVPLAYLIHTDPDEAQVAIAQAQDAPRGSLQGPEGQARIMAQMQFQAALDLARLWVSLTLSNATSTNLSSLRSVFIRIESQRAALEKKIVGDAGMEDVAKGIDPVVQPLRTDLDGALRPLLSADQTKAYEAWRNAAPASPPPGEERPDPSGMLRQFIPLESEFLHLAVTTNINDSQLADAARLYRDAIQTRDALIPRLAKLMSANQEESRADGEKFQAEAFAIPGSVEGKLKAILTPAQAKKFTAWQLSQQPPFMRRTRAKPPEPALGANAFVLVNPQTGEPRLFDFVHIPERSGGWKVRLGKDQPWDGMTVIDLIFEASDRWLLAESLAYDLHRRAGLAASRTEFVRLDVDGHPAGYFLAIEQLNKAYLRQRKIRDDGNLYKATWMGNGLIETHEKHTHRHAGHDDLVQLVEELQKTKQDPNAQWAVIRRAFDVEEVIGHYAVRMLISDWDGFFNNYFLYHDIKGTKKWTFYPWDEDKTWGEYDGWEQEGMLVEMPLSYAAEGDHPPGEPAGRPSESYGFRSWWRAGGPIARPLLANPIFRKAFLARMKELLETEFNEARLFPLIEAYRDRLREEVTYRAQVAHDDPAKAQKQLEAHLASFKEFIVKRRRWLLEQPDLRDAGAFDRSQLK